MCRRCFTRGKPMTGGQDIEPCAFAMVRHDFRLMGRCILCISRESFDYFCMNNEPLFFRQARISSFLEHNVAKRIVRPLSNWLRQHNFCSHQLSNHLREFCLAPSTYTGDNVVSKPASERCRNLRQLLCRTNPVQPRRQQCMQTCGDIDCLRRCRSNGRVLPGQLFDKQRNTFRAIDNSHQFRG